MIETLARDGAARRAAATGIVGVFLLLTAAGCGPAESHPSAGPFRHLVLLTVDTWRADLLDVKRGGIPITPQLGPFLARSIRFSAASSVGNETSPGVAGILTGLYPGRSGVLINDHILSSVVPTLATVLSANGFVSSGFVANPVVGPQFGFGNGFDHYQVVVQRHPYRKAKAEAVNRAALEWLDGAADGQRLFLWAHYMEPHGPYEPVQEVRDLFSIDAFDAPTEVPLLGPDQHSGRHGVPWYQQVGLFEASQDGRDYLLRYAAEVRCLDRALARLLAELATRGILDDAVIVIAADHGEALLDDHGYYFSHNNGLTEDQTATPLVLYFPGCSAGVEDRPVSNVDIFPTICDLLGVKPPELDGFHLLQPRVPRVVVSQSGGERAIREGSLKLRQVRAERRFTLVDLAADPGETQDLSERFPKERQRLQERLREITQRAALAEPVRRQLLAEQLEALEALGYVQRNGPSSGPDEGKRAPQ